MVVHSAQVYIQLKPLFSRHNGIGVQFTDEPTSNLDPENSHKVMQMLRDISKSGTTVILSTHELEYLSYVNRVFKMDCGTLK